MPTRQPPQKKFEAQLRSLPAKPGVYIFKNARGSIIYVGKAQSLRNRVRSYFGSTHAWEQKVRKLVEQIDNIEFILTGSVQEALLLEATLVKQHQPFFNVRLKDDKHYPYLKIDLREDWPRVQITRRIASDGARYFGPFASAGSVRRTLDLVKKLFPWRSCTKEITGNDPRPCLEYYIHRCIGPCASLCTKEEYDTVIQQTTMFLEGRTEEITRQLRREMQDTSAKLEYERAARLRDQVQSIDRTTERQVMEVRDRTDMDVFGLAREEQEAYVQVFFVRKGLMTGRDIFQLDGTADETDAEILRSFVEQFYESAPYVPARVLLPVAIDDRDLIEQWLTERRGKNVRVQVPERGEKRMLVDRAVTNARESLQQARAKWMADRGKKDQALQQLQDELELPALPSRIECYDISNIQGTSAVGSMVVFEDGNPKKSEYRRFRIKDVQGQNDFAMMQEVLKRRFWRFRRQSQEEGANEGAPTVNGASAGPHDHPVEAADIGEELEQPNAGARMTDPGDGREYDASFGSLPDFVIVDGGKGQVSAAHDAMRNMGIGHIPLAGLAKRFEELFVVGVSEPVVLDRTSQALYLVQRIRDEAHRFAITYHRGVRSKTGMRSALDEVPGVGPKRKKALLRKFGSVKAIREATVEEIAETPGFTRKVAEKVLEAI
ncbi:MAG TPA: excinuclease ABC subunit UvrC [Dehalococcoidia bacterium]|nr:excinuclease ABC subunit UvrC [Dehalococcoidia bacterium]